MYQKVNHIVCAGFVVKVYREFLEWMLLYCICVDAIHCPQHVPGIVGMLLKVDV